MKKIVVLIGTILLVIGGCSQNINHGMLPISSLSEGSRFSLTQMDYEHIEREGGYEVMQVLKEGYKSILFEKDGTLVESNHSLRKEGLLE
ncbi:hypothetical protein DMA11_07080 [Marinilabiliaceae bacterium JC017]|nr:hypothetical protein DMA11_07080 [Marinilabiliaceae bacterium JC017]